MTWGEWMIPQPGPEHLLTLERQRRAAEQFTEEQARKTLVQLCELTMRQDLIIRSATKRIAELELQQLLGTGSEALPEPEPGAAEGCVPWPVRMILRLYGYRIALGDR